MQKTLSALDDLFSGVVGLIPTWCSMLKSTRFLTVLITVGVLIWAWKFGGLSDMQAEIVSVVGGLIGVNFSWTKTIGKKYETVEATAATDTTAASTTAAAVVNKISTEPTSSYIAPLDVDGYIKSLGVSIDEQYDECKSIISNYNLLSIHPSVRVTVAEQVLDKTIDLAKAVWPSVVGLNSSGGAFYRAPEASDYKDYASKQSFDKAVRDAIPGCQYMPEGASVMFRDMEEYYSDRANLTLLEGKSIGWYEADGKTPRIKAIYTLAGMGLSAVA